MRSHGPHSIFVLYIAAERTKDAIVIGSARVNRKSKSVKVVISNLDKKEGS